jgi:hypothetical protein
LYYSSCNGFIQCSLVKFGFNVNPIVQPIQIEEHYLRKNSIMHKSQYNLVTQNDKRGIPERSNTMIQDYNAIVLQDRSPNKSHRVPDNLEEYFFGDETKGYILTDDSYDFSKEYVQKLIYALINPLEDSYETVKQIFYKYIFFAGIKTKDLPELIIHKGAKNIDKLYQTLGFEKFNLTNRLTLTKYKTKIMGRMNISRKSLKKSSSKNPFVNRFKKKKSTKPLDMKNLGKDDDMIFASFLPPHETDPDADETEELKQAPNDWVIVRATEPNTKMSQPK